MPPSKMPVERACEPEHRHSIYHYAFLLSRDVAKIFPSVMIRTWPSMAASRTLVLGMFATPQNLTHLYCWNCSFHRYFAKSVGIVVCSRLLWPPIDRKNSAGAAVMGASAVQESVFAPAYRRIGRFARCWHRTSKKTRRWKLVLCFEYRLGCLRNP